MTEGPPQVARVEPGDVTPTLVTALYTGALVSRVEAGVVALTGPGAVTSFQGLLTNDVELPGDGSFVYGALLTPKGMIVVDGWAARLGATVSYTVPAHGGGRGGPALRGGAGAGAGGGTPTPPPGRPASPGGGGGGNQRPAPPPRRGRRGCFPGPRAPPGPGAFCPPRAPRPPPPMAGAWS